MSDCQFMGATVSADRYCVNRLTGIGKNYSSRMNTKSRSEYGQRLYTARKQAGLTQTALAKAAGMSQSTYQEAETTGARSTYTSQLAAACGVSAQWLATGAGSMLDGTGNDKTETDKLADALKVLTKALQKADKNARIAIEPLLASMAQDPQDSANKSRLILRLLITDNVQPARADNDRPGHTSGELGRLTLGDEAHGRGDSAAATGGGKR